MPFREAEKRLAPPPERHGVRSLQREFPRIAEGNRSGDVMTGTLIAVDIGNARIKLGVLCARASHGAPAASDADARQ